MASGLPSARLSGRHSELEAISAALDRARRGLGGAVFVVGEPGVGKTTLVTTALEDAGEYTIAAWGSGWDGDGAPALWPWIQVLRRLGAPPDLLARVGGARSSDEQAEYPDPDGQRFRLFDAICEYLLAVPDGLVRVLVIEDVHWADPATITVLELLASRVRDRSVLILGTYRAEELPRSVVRDLARHGDVVSLRGLDREDVASLLADHAGFELEPDRVDAVWQRTGGNPLFVRELGRLVRMSGDTSGPVPEGIRQVIDRRFARLAQPVVALLEVVAVVGPVAALDLAAGVRGLTAAAALDLVEVGAAAGVVQLDHTGHVRFTHDLFRATLLAGLGDRRRQELHLAVAQALVEQSPDPTGLDVAQIAEHFAEALTIGGAVEATHYATLAAEQASAQLAYDAAADWYARALAALDLCGPPDEQRRIALLVARADAARRSGSVATSREALARAVGLIRASGHRELLPEVALASARIGGRTGMSDTSTGDLLAEALALLDRSGPCGDEPGARDDDVRARLLAAMARDEYHHGEGMRDPAALAEEAVQLARGGRSSTLSFCLTAQHDATWQPGNAAARLVLADEIATLADRAGDLDARVEADLLRYAARFELGDPLAGASFQRYAHSAGLSRQPRHRYYVASRWAMQALATGRFRDAERLIDEAATLAHDIGEADGPVVALNQRWELCSDLGRRAELVDTLELFAAYTTHEVIWLDLALARAAADDRSGGRAALARVAANDIARIRPAYARPWVAALLVEAAVELGQPALMERGRAALEAASGSGVVVGGAVVFHGAADHHLGVLHAGAGEHDRSVERFRSAVAFHERIGARPWIVRSRLGLRDALLRIGADPEVAADLDRSARAIAAEIGMPLPAPAAPETQGPSLSRRGDVWTFTYLGHETRLKHAKGLQDLATLLARPGVEVAATDLTLGPNAPAERGADVVLDAVAKRSYAERIEHLELLMARADRRGDAPASAAAAAEREALLAELASATGLGGRSRRLGDPSERARKAVAARLRDVISRITDLDPALGDHLATSITTGARCVYRPAKRTPWSVTP